MKKKNITLIGLIILGILFIIIGSTFAYIIWNSNDTQKTDVVFTVESNFSCSANVGGDISSSDAHMKPTTVSDRTIGNYIKREVKVKPTLNLLDNGIYMELWLNINELGEELSKSDNFMYSLTTSNTSNMEGVIVAGNFKDKQVGDKITLIDKKKYLESTTETYYLWIWLDSMETNIATAGQTFNLSLGGVCSGVEPYSEDILNGNYPKIEDGMIPVVFDTSEGTKVKTIFSDDSNWYNYKNKEWANAVLVSDSSRNKYLNTSGVEVLESDILAYYVYVPRYKYKIWETNLGSTGKEQEIEIVFEDKNTSKSMGTKVGEYRTHPAFTFGDTELNGIWVGKFETGGTATSPLIKPNIISLTNQTISQAFITTQIFGSSGYGMSNKSDAHMIKNSEWGAVGYLSHSKYGRCTNGVCEKVRRNNNSARYTGYGAVHIATSSVAGSSSSTNEFGTTSDITQPYDTEVGYKASTTGNITGVYDMAGGMWEVVMGVLADPSGNPFSGNSSTENSGFNGKLFDGSMYTSGTSFPDSKYYDLYTSTDPSSNSSSLTLTACNGGICYGHALSETNLWYSVSISFVTASHPWGYRGGSFSFGNTAGLFLASRGKGNAYDDYASRAVLVIID